MAEKSIARIKKQPLDRLVWFVPVCAFVCGPVANMIGDLFYICIRYGSDAYFEKGLRFVKHKPFTLSNGSILSNDAGFVVFLIDATLWIGFVLLASAIMIRFDRHWIRKAQNPTKN